MSWILGLFNLVGQGIGGLFNFKSQQAEVVGQALKTMGDVSMSNGDREQAIAQIIAAEASSGYWLAACWRPLLMIVFAGMIISFWFGYVPPHMNQKMPEMMGRILDLMQLGIGGYIGGRTVEKIVSSIGLAGVLRQYIQKKMM